MNNENKTVLVAGSAGMDGSEIIDLLISKKYGRIVALNHNGRDLIYSNLSHILNEPNVIIEKGDITNYSSLAKLVDIYKPDEFYNFAAQSANTKSWNIPAITHLINTIGVSNCLEAIRLHSPKTRFFQASTAEVYSASFDLKQNEDSPTVATTPYTVSKLAAENLVKIYRSKYNLYCCFARLFSHTSSRQAESFIGRKITKGIARLMKNNDRQLVLGNIDIKRDFMHAKDAVAATHGMLQFFEPQDLVIGSGEVHSIRDFVNECFANVGITDWSKYIVENDPQLYQPNHGFLCADITRAKKLLGWKPQISFKSVSMEMMIHDSSAVIS